MRWICLVAAGLCLAGGRALGQQGRPTPLLQEDFQTGRRVRIDASSDSLDAEFDRVLGPDAGFSTSELVRVLERLRAELRRERPRATPKLIVFLYPGRVDVERLRALREIFVDLELVLDPCERSVCREAVAKHIEMVGRAVGQPVLGAGEHRFVFKLLQLAAVPQTRGDEPEQHRVPIAEAVAVAGHPGGGLAWLAARRRAEEEYEPLCVRAIARQAAARRVALTAPARVNRDGGAVHVLMRVQGDRARIEQDVIQALAAALAGLRQNPATPKEVHLEVELQVAGGRPAQRRFRADGEPVGQLLDGRLAAAALWKSYVEDVTRRKDATRLDFAADP